MQDSAENGMKKKQQQPRQLLSCTKCRERKVKCDRTKPCTACCARGQPKECHFLVSDGGDYGPIQQSYELRRLRAENLQMKRVLRAHGLSGSDEEEADTPSFAHHDARSQSNQATNGSATIKHRKLKAQDSPDNLYFGSPGLAKVVTDFARLHLSPQSLTHLMPRAIDMYASPPVQAYPFATMWPALPQDCSSALLNCLPAREDFFRYLDAYQERAQCCSFPHLPDNITRGEVERFLSDASRNAELFPDMLALLFAILAQGFQACVFDQRKNASTSADLGTSKGDVYIAAAMQALRMASFMNRPTLLNIQALIILGPYLTNSGRFLDAWTLFGTTIRLAHSIGLHRDPRLLEPVPPPRECALRQTLWWWMLHMDQEYSVTLGRPLGISGIGDCPPLEPLTTNPTTIRFGDFVNQFTVLARQMLSTNRLSNTRIDDFTYKLTILWESLPEMLQFNEKWIDEKHDIPEWPLDVMAAAFYGKLHNYIILLNRQRLDDNSSDESPIDSPIAAHYPLYNSNGARTSSPSSTSRNPSSGASPIPLANGTGIRHGRAAVIASSMSLLNAFLFFAGRMPWALVCWSIGQQAFNASLILLLDISEATTRPSIGTDVREIRERLLLVGRAQNVFLDLKTRGIHHLAELAAERLGDVLAQVKEQVQIFLQQHRQQLQQAQQQRQKHAQDHRNRRPTPQQLLPTINHHNHLRLQKLFCNDSVMSPAGMFLLEDPGLHAHRPEEYSPLTWRMAECTMNV